MNRRIKLHPGCTEIAWRSFIDDRAENARIVKLKGRRVIGYERDGSYVFGFLHARKWKIYCHCISFSEDAIIAMAFIMHFLKRSKAGEE